MPAVQALGLRAAPVLLRRKRANLILNVDGCIAARIPGAFAKFSRRVEGHQATQRAEVLTLRWLQKPKQKTHYQC